MKLLLFLLLSISFIAGENLSAGEKRVEKISAAKEKITLPLEIVRGENIPVVRYAADELQKYLSRMTGKKIPIVNKPSAGKFHLILGDNALARKDGLLIGKLPYEGFYMKRSTNQVFLLGKDAKKSDPYVRKYLENYDRGTLNAVYTFLEKFCGVRFYFPHDMGIIVPEKRSLVLPETFTIMDRPDLRSRHWGIRGQGISWPDDQGRPDVPARSMLQLRMRATPYAQSNSLNRFDFVRRFGKTHPEYFAMMENGKRYNDPGMKMTGQLCFESNIREEIYQDIKAYLTGKKASSRGMKRYDYNAFNPGTVTICPQDWFYWCGCPKCRKIAAPGRDRLYREKAQQQKVSDYIWQFTADLANRMKKEGVKGKLVQLAYFPYNLPPKCDIPDNVLVAVATFPGIASADHPRMKITEAQVKPWLTKAKGGILFRAWTGKTMARNIKYIPAMKHNHIGDYFAKRRFRYAGAYIDEYSDNFLFTYLNLYLFCKMAWDQNTDHKAVLEEHFRLMFGKAAPQMRTFYDDLEKLWNDKILATSSDSGLGLTISVPGEIELWTKIYSSEKMAYYNKLFDEAEKRVSGKTLQRVRFIRKNLFGYLLKGFDTFARSRNSISHWKLSPGKSVYLRPHRGKYNEVQTLVTFRQTQTHLIFDFDCEEPFMKEIKSDAVKQDSADTWQDSDVELFILPHKDSKTYFQFIANANGVLSDYEHGRKGMGKGRGLAWNSKGTAKAQKLSDRWKVTVSIPKKALGKFDQKSMRVNLGRRRVFKTSRKIVEEFYKWAPYSGGTFHHIHNWGTLLLTKDAAVNLLKDPSFSGKMFNKWNVGAWSVWWGPGNHKGQSVTQDKKYFITGGSSLHLVNTPGNAFGISQRVKNLKPDTKYRLSFYIRTENVQRRRSSLFSGLYVFKGRNIHLPSTYISGTNEWTRMAFEFTTPGEKQLNRKAPFGITMRAPGKVWVDEMILEEIKK